MCEIFVHMQLLSESGWKQPVMFLKYAAISLIIYLFVPLIINPPPTTYTIDGHENKMTLHAISFEIVHLY